MLWHLEKMLFGIKYNTFRSKIEVKPLLLAEKNILHFQTLVQKECGHKNCPWRADSISAPCTGLLVKSITS